MSYAGIYKLIGDERGIMRHFQVSHQIKEAIRLGHHKVGEQLPPERKLEELLCVSRGTIRRAFDELEREGIITRKWGKGVYVNTAIQNKTATGSIGLTVWQGGSLAYHPATLEILNGINEILCDKPLDLKIIPITPEIINRGDYEKTLGRCSLDGVIIIAREIPDEHILEIKKVVPNIVLTQEFGNEPSVIMGWAKAGYDLTRYLINLGHKKIGFLNGAVRPPAAHNVCDGFKKALSDCSIDFNSEWVKFGDYTSKSGFDLTLDIMSRKETPTAIIAGDDFMALGAIKALRELRICCPEEVSIASFNNFPFAKYVVPPLTTVHVPFYELGRELALTLINILEGHRPEDKKINQMHLIERQSTDYVCNKSLINKINESQMEKTFD